MRYYVYDPLSAEYECYVPGIPQLNFYDETRRGKRWTPVRLELADEDGPGLPSDFPDYAGHTPLFSPHAWQALEPLIAPDVEALPVIGAHGELLAINVTTILHGTLDLDRSECVFNDVTRAVSAVYRYHLRNYELGNSHIFKLEETRRLKVYVSDVFKEAVEAAGLVGLSFNEIWDTTRG